MRILFILSTPFCPEHFSGPNRTVLELSQKLSKSGHEALVLAGQSQSDGIGGIVTDRSFGFRLFRASAPRRSIVPLCITLRPHIVVLVNTMEEGLVEACRSVDIPLAVWFHEVDASLWGDDLADRHTQYIASSSFVATRLLHLAGIKAEIIPPYIEQANYRKSRRGKRVLFVNPTRDKGVEIAFEVAARRPLQAFTLVESGQLSNQWRNHCFERAMKCGNIEWFAASNDINAILDQTCLLLLPRFSEEGFCRLVTEAQLGGIPALASNRGHLAANVGAGGAVLDVDAGIDEWLNSLDRFFDDDSYHVAVSQAAMQHALRSELDTETVLHRFLKVLDVQITKYKKRRFSRIRG
jgi:glycosyltransferase involved in cell wall biosynthesis